MNYVEIRRKNISWAIGAAPRWWRLHPITGCQSRSDVLVEHSSLRAPLLGTGENEEVLLVDVNHEPRRECRSSDQLGLQFLNLFPVVLQLVALEAAVDLHADFREQQSREGEPGEASAKFPVLEIRFRRRLKELERP